MTEVGRDELLEVPGGTITSAGLAKNLDVGIQYLEAWLSGNGAVPLYNLMEDAATAEISRTQVWQWLRHRATLDDGRSVTRELVDATTAEVLARLKARTGGRFDPDRLALATRIFGQMMTGTEFAEFLTLAAYDYLD